VIGQEIKKPFDTSDKLFSEKRRLGKELEQRGLFQMEGPRSTVEIAARASQISSPYSPGYDRYAGHQASLNSSDVESIIGDNGSV
jgi:hypothetical protein